MNTKRTPSLDDLAPNDRAAVVAFRDRHGDTWKQDLLDCWVLGHEFKEPDGAHLRRVRNYWGPKWLAKLKE